MSTDDTPQPGEREEMERPTWLLDTLRDRRHDRWYTLSTPGNLRLLADWIEDLERGARDHADALTIVHMDATARATDRARERITYLTRELEDKRDACAALIAGAQANEYHIAYLTRELAEARAEVERLRALVEDAWREGHGAGLGDGETHPPRSDWARWEDSDAHDALAPAQEGE